MLFKSVKIGEKEYKFRITNASQCQIEEKIGPLLNALDHVMEGKVFSTIIWGALYPLQHEVTLERASDLVDEMVDEGVIAGSEARVDFVIDLLKDAGFFSEQEVEEIKKVNDFRKGEGKETDTVGKSDRVTEGKEIEQQSITELTQEAYPQALQCGIRPFDFWDMTYREVGDIIQAHNENEKNEIRKNCMISYNTAALFRIAVASVLDDNIKFPSIHQAFPDLFGEEKQENQQDGQQDWRIQKDRIEQYARLLKAKRGEKINDN